MPLAVSLPRDTRAVASRPVTGLMPMVLALAGQLVAVTATVTPFWQSLGRPAESNRASACRRPPVLVCS